MKKLIALLLLPCMAWGQVYDNIVEDKSLPDDYWLIPVAMGDSIGTAEIQFEAVDTSWYFAYPTGEVIHGGDIIDIVAGDHIELDFDEINNRLTVKSKQWPVDTFLVDTTFYYRSTHEDEILFLLELYERECYKDSTESRYDFFKYEGKLFKQEPSIDPGFYPNYSHTGYVWEHREPTFIGFIKWLKARK